MTLQQGPVWAIQYGKVDTLKNIFTIRLSWDEGVHIELALLGFYLEVHKMYV